MRTLLISALVMISCGVFAQTTPQKIGYADTEYIFSQMPQYRQIESDLKTHGQQLEAQLKAKYTEYETKRKAYEASFATMVDAVKKDKEAELVGLEQGIQKFQQEAQASLQKKQADLMEPIISKIGNAIAEVAKENGFSFIINPQLGPNSDILLYTDEKYNISDLVLKKMGITPTASAGTTK